MVKIYEGGLCRVRRVGVILVKQRFIIYNLRGSLITSIEEVESVSEKKSAIFFFKEG